MRIVCAWCERSLGSKAGNGELISHSLCEECRQRLCREASLPSFQAFLDSLEMPILVVNNDVQAVGANRRASKVLGQTFDQLKGLRGGAIFECSHASEPQGCGRTVHCSGCALRRSVVSTHQTGLPNTHVTVHQTVETPEGEKVVRFVITTEKAGDMILLRIDETPPLSMARSAP